MKCSHCGRFGVKLHEEYDGRKVIHLCDFCKSEAEWKKWDGSIPPLPKPGFLKKIIESLKSLWKR